MSARTERLRLATKKPRTDGSGPFHEYTAAHLEKMLRAYYGEDAPVVHREADGLREIIIDTLTDLRHLADWYGVDLPDCDNVAQRHYEAEKDRADQ